MTNVTNIYGAIDVRFDTVLFNDVSILLSTNILAIAPYVVLEDSAYHELGVRVVSRDIGGDAFIECSVEIDETVIDKSLYPLGALYDYHSSNIRIYIHNADISVYVDGTWVYSYVLGYVNYVTDLVVASLSVHGGELTIDNIKVTELHDYRDAVYVDYEATADSAMQSVIQERPIQIFSEPERKLSFTYQTIKNVLVAHHVKEFSQSTQPNSNISSDGLIYYTNVSINTSAITADEVGLITRLYRLSNLETGAVRATKILQKLAIERRNPLNILMRFDPRLVIADELIIGPDSEGIGGVTDNPLYATGTGTQIHEYCVIEDLNLQFQDGNYSFTVSGRTLKADV